MTNNRPGWLNGDFAPLDALSVSVLDHGFLYGDGIYEVIPVFHRKPRCLDDHLERFAASAAGIDLHAMPSADDWRAVVDELITRSPDDDHIVYLQITRGTPPPGAPFQKRFPDDTAPTLFAMTQPRTAPPNQCTAIMREDARWGHCCWKTTLLLESVRATEAALQVGAAEAILHRGEEITEGATSNVFAVVDGVIRTPPLSPQILPGVTRKLLLQLLTDTEYFVSESTLSCAELACASEVWLTGSTRGVLPVVQIDDAPVGDGMVGPVATMARTRYQVWCAAL